MKTFKELKTNDFVYFKNKSGSASTIKLNNNLIYFVPSKHGMQVLEGTRKPIVKHERFTVADIIILKKDIGEKRIVRINLIRHADSTIVRISEKEFIKYFYGF